MEGQKFSQDKLSWWTVLFTQMPNAIEEIVRCSNAGHLKYPHDLDWKNFERVKDGQNQYKNAAIRHIKESETHIFNKDMAEYDPKVRHLAQGAWNLLILLELQIRDENLEINKESSNPIQYSVEQGTPITINTKYGTVQLGTNEKLNVSPKGLKIEQSEACKKAVRDACNSNKYELKGTYAYTNPIQKKKLEKFRELAEEYESNPNTVGDLAKFISYYSRPTLSIDELLGSDDYPDFHNQEG